MDHHVFLPKPVYEADNNPKPPPKGNGTKGPKEPQGPPQPIDGGYGKKYGSSAKRNCTARRRLGVGSGVNSIVMEGIPVIPAVEEANFGRQHVAAGHNSVGPIIARFFTSHGPSR